MKKKAEHRLHLLPGITYPLCRALHRGNVLAVVYSNFDFNT